MVARRTPAGVPALPDSVTWCERHGIGASIRGWTCPRCADDPTPQREPVRVDPRVAKPTRRAGQEAEDALCRLLNDAGLFDIETAPPTCVASNLYVREYGWGAHLVPPRGWRFDAAVPARRLAFEVEGQVHSIKGKRTGDVLRDQAAQRAGWRVVRLLPSQVRDDTAAEVVRGAVNTGAGA